MATKHIIVVFKPLGARVPPPAGLPPELAPVYERRRLARQEHLRTVREIRGWLAATHLEARVVDSPGSTNLTGADLVVTVGGDGTFLHTARHVASQPMLGVNSSPSTSIGHYCGCTLDTFPPTLEAFLEGRAQPRRLVRIAIDVDGRPLPFMALNEVLFANTSPAASTRYALQVNGLTELQLSSGIWIATASGSTAAIRSAGGEIMAARDKRLQYLVREPYHAPGAAALSLLDGYLDGGLEIVSRSDRNALFLDGHVDVHPVTLGEHARVRPAPEPLLVYAYGE